MRLHLLLASLWAVAFAQESRAADLDLLHVYDAQHPSSDSRLVERHDVDHPVGFAPAFKDRAEWERRAAALREQVLVAEGLWPMPERGPLEPVIHGTIDRDEYTIEKVYFRSMPGHYVSGNLYRPKGKPGRLPAVLCPHGHWTNGRLIWNTDAVCKKQMESGAESTIEGARSPLQARCAMLARMGCVVFFYDMVGYADSTEIEHRKGFTDAESILRLQSFMGLQAWNGVRALDFLASLPDVDPARIAVTGASGGATQTLILGAIDPRPAAAFPAVMVSMAMQGGCVCENAPLLRVNTNNVELAALFAPKPLGMSSANDWTKDLETKGLPELKTIYSLYGASDDVAAKHLSFEHNYNQPSRELMYNWFNTHLKLGLPGPIKEKPFVPASPAELSVFDAGHPRPADATGAAGVRAAMTAASAEQMERLARSPAEYRKALSVALRVMMDAAPVAAADVEVASAGEAVRKGYRIDKGEVVRRGAAGRIPCVILTPADWGGRLVIWAHPEGKASLIGADGEPVAAVRTLLDQKAAVLCGDLFLTGESVPAVGGNGALSNFAPTYSPSSNPPYAGFHFAYNRSLLAERVNDLLTLVAFAHRRESVQSVDLVGVGKAGPWALCARALAGEGVGRAAIDLNGFDFDQVKEASDEMMLPGALKYGGLAAFATLCDGRPTVLANPAGGKAWSLPLATPSVTVRSGATNEVELAASLGK